MKSISIHRMRIGRYNFPEYWVKYAAPQTLKSKVVCPLTGIVCDSTTVLPEAVGTRLDVLGDLFDWDSGDGNFVTGETGGTFTEVSVTREDGKIIRMQDDLFGFRFFFHRTRESFDFFKDDLNKADLDRFYTYAHWLFHLEKVLNVESILLGCCPDLMQREKTERMAYFPGGIVPPDIPFAL